MADEAPDEDLVIYHPNRDKASSRAMQLFVIVLLLVSAGLIALITLGGWASLEGDQIVSVGYIIIYVLMAYYTSRWSRGVLPLAAALAIIMLVFAAIAAPGWFSRNHSGYDNPGLPPDLIGLLTVVLIPVQLLVIAIAMRAFQQEWNIEIEMTPEERDRRHKSQSGGGRGVPQPQG